MKETCMYFNDETKRCLINEDDFDMETGCTDECPDFDEGEDLLDEDSCEDDSE